MGSPCDGGGCWLADRFIVSEAPMRITNDRRQRADDEHCGSVCAAVALDLCGFAPDESTARVASGLPVSPMDGVHPSTMEAFLRRQGLRCQSGEMTLADLRHHTRQGRPVLTLTADNGGHWVVVTDATRAVTFHCPLAGERSSTKAAWESKWFDQDRYGVVYRRFGLAVWKD